MLIASGALYIPLLVEDVTFVTVAGVVSITSALDEAKFDPIAKLDIALPAASDNEPALNAIPDAVRSEEVSPACTVYVPEAVLEPLIELIVTVRSLVPVSKVTTKLPPAKVTASLKVTVTLTVSSVLYVPSVVVDVTDVIVGAVLSNVTLPDPLVTAVPAFPTLSVKAIL
jgi:hypothetical protein